MANDHDAGVSCPACGQTNDANARFCNSCGHRIATGVQSAAEAPTAVEATADAEATAPKEPVAEPGEVRTHSGLYVPDEPAAAAPTAASVVHAEQEELRLVGLGSACLLVALGLYGLRFLGLPGWVPDQGVEYTGFLMVVTFPAGLFALVVGALFKGLPRSRLNRGTEGVITALLSLGVFIVPICMTIEN